ncbi:MAG: hypothetical protein WCA46_18285 [Actinocatenispora sp.]
MNELEHFDFEGLDQSAIGYHPDHGALVHKTKFMKWLGFDVKNASRTEARHLPPGDVLPGIFSPIGGGNEAGRKADALTKRGVRRLLFRSDKPLAIEYADRVLDMLEELDRSGMVVDERITDEQIRQGHGQLASIAQRRLEERMDYKSILQSLKRGGAVDTQYAQVQNTLYRSLFGMTAAQIRRYQPQRNGVPRKSGEGFCKSTVAKDYLTEDQLRLLDGTVLATIAQIEFHHPSGAPAAEMIDAIHRAVALMDQRQIGA